jgi:hypothetical protein
MDSLTKKIKDTLGIPRKFYWPKVNGRHESLVKEWPQNSNVTIEIKGLGAGPDRISMYEAMICLEGKTTKEATDDHFCDIIEDREYLSCDEVWVSDLQHISTSKKIKKFIYPGTKKFFVFDRVLPSDPTALKKKSLGKIRLKLEDQILESWNNISFEEALREQMTDVRSNFLRIPALGVSIDVRVVRIRSFVPALLKCPLIVEWDMKIQETIDSGMLSHHPDGIYITDIPGPSEMKPSEEIYPRALGIQFIENFKETGKLDWRIVFGPDELTKEDEGTTPSWCEKTRLIGEGFIWDDTPFELQPPTKSAGASRPPPLTCPSGPVEQVEGPSDPELMSDVRYLSMPRGK